jgi:nucleoid-associated protein YgaU
VQAKLHRLRATQHLLRGLCAGLSVFLIFVLSIKTKHPHTSQLEAGPLFPPPPITESVADAKSEALSPAEIPDRPASASERSGAVEELVRPAPVTQVASPATADKEEDRIIYTVQKGDSLWLICKRMLGEGEAMSRIARENNIADPRSLKVGEVIYLSRK